MSSEADGQTPALLAAALRYAAQGWRVVPLVPREKAPLIADWPALASRDREVVQGWFTKWPNANVGVATGTDSGVVVLDVDPRNGGLESMEALVAKLGPLPSTRRSISGRGDGGHHLYFRHPDEAVRSGTLADGIDLLGDKKQAVAPPSIHPKSKAPYVWEDEEMEVAELPAAWVAYVAGRDRSRASKPGSSSAVLAVATTSLSAGRRHTGLTSLAGKLVNAGLRGAELEQVLAVANDHRCTPPLPVDEVNRIVASTAAWPARARTAPPVRSPARRLRDFGADARARFARRADGLELPVRTPWNGLNAVLGGGLWPGVHVLVGATGTGRTQLALQLGASAAHHGDVPVGYVGLEIDPAQLVARVDAFRTGQQWSDVVTGRQPAALSEPSHAGWEFRAADLIYVEQGSPRGWPHEWLYSLAEQIRADHPEATDPNGNAIPGSRPMLLIIDFLQIVGEMASLEGPGRPLDARQRISQAAYGAHHVATRFDAAVLLISSASRDHYGRLADDADRVGLGRERQPDGTLRTTIDHPEYLMGTGKESGDIEYAATTVTVGLALPATSQSKTVLAATVKNRLGRPGWSALSFDGARFTEIDPAVVNLPGEKQESGVSKRKGPGAARGQYSEDA